MVQILIGYILLLFDPMPTVLYFDLLPDYFGYALIIWGLWKIKGVAKENVNVAFNVKYGIMTSAVLFVYSYVICIFGMFGKLNHMSAVASLALNIASDVGEIVFAYFVIKTLQALQEDKEYFQIKRMMLLVKIIAFIDICMYIAYTKPLTYATFMVFELITSVILMVYILSSMLTYRQRYIKKKDIQIGKNVNNSKNNKNISSKANILNKGKEKNNFKNVVNTKKIKK